MAQTHAPARIGHSAHRPRARTYTHTRTRTHTVLTHSAPHTASWHTRVHVLAQSPGVQLEFRHAARPQAFWHSRAHVPGQTLELDFGATSPFCAH
eukprot:1153677-Pelagomonas_calceolata.AAC.1